MTLEKGGDLLWQSSDFIITKPRRNLSITSTAMESVRQMVEDGRDCSEVLIQLAAVKSAINGVGKVILKDHIDHCIVDAVEQGDRKAIEDLEKAIDQFIK